MFIVVCDDGLGAGKGEGCIHVRQRHDKQNDTRIIGEASRHEVQKTGGWGWLRPGNQYTRKTGGTTGTRRGRNIQDIESQECDVRNVLTRATGSGASMAGGDRRYRRVER